MKRAITALAVLALAGGTAGCAKRQIDVERTGSVPIEGTTWMLFCDGPNAFIWVPDGPGDSSDDLEAVIYDHHLCVDDGLAPPVEDPARGDPDGLLGEDD